MSKRVVLTVSGVIAADIREQIASGKRPRADYLELARSFNADLLDYAAARTIAGRTGAVLEKLGGPNLVLAYACWKVRKNCQAIVTDGEQVGLPLAALLKITPGMRPRHLMIVHVISEPKKTVFLDWLGVQSAIDRFITYSRWQQRFIEDRWKLSPNRVLWTPFMVDQEFFAPNRVAPNSSAPLMTRGQQTHGRSRNLRWATNLIMCGCLPPLPGNTAFDFGTSSLRPTNRDDANRQGGLCSV